MTMARRYKAKGGTEAFLYCITDGRHYKIGWAVDPQQRLKVLQVGNPNPLKIHDSIRCNSTAQAQARERNVHRLHRKHRVRGEWFTAAVADNPFGKYKDAQPHVWVEGIGLQKQLA